MKRHKRTLREIATDMHKWSPEHVTAYVKAQEDMQFGPAESTRIHYTDADLYDGQATKAGTYRGGISPLDGFGCFTERKHIADRTDAGAVRAEKVRALWADVVRPKLTAGQAVILDAALSIGDWSASDVARLCVTTQGKNKGKPMVRQSAQTHMRRIEAILSENMGTLVDTGVFDDALARVNGAIH